MAPEKSTRQNRVREALGRIYDQHPPYFKEYLQRFQDDPTSRVFAPLAEAYRKMGQVDEAISICQEGLQHHPEFHGGRVALAKCFIDKKNFDGARAELERVVQYVPENLMAQRLLGDTYHALNNPLSALHCYKMALLLSPEDITLIEKVREVEKKSESNSVDQAPLESLVVVALQPEASVEELLPFPPVPTPAEIVATERPTVDAVLGLKEESGEEPYRVEHVSHVFAEDKDPNKKEITTETLGDLYFSQGQFDRSLRIFEKLERHFPSPELSRKISQCRAKLGVDRESIIKGQQIELLRSLLKKVRDEKELA